MCGGEPRKLCVGSADVWGSPNMWPTPTHPHLAHRSCQNRPISFYLYQTHSIIWPISFFFCIKHILLFDRYHSRYHSILYQTHSPISFFLRLGFVSNTFLHIMLSFFRYHSSFQTHSSVFHRKAISFYVGWTLFRYHSSISFLRLVLVSISFFNIILKVGTCIDIILFVAISFFTVVISFY